MDLAAQAAGLGLPPEMAAALAASAAAAAPEAFEVMPENWDAMRLFLAMETQWRRAGMSGIATGLDYAVLRPVARLFGLATSADLFDRVRILEGAALLAMAERHRR